MAPVPCILLESRVMRAIICVFFLFSGLGCGSTCMKQLEAARADRPDWTDAVGTAHGNKGIGMSEESQREDALQVARINGAIVLVSRYLGTRVSSVYKERTTDGVQNVEDRLRDEAAGVVKIRNTELWWERVRDTCGDKPRTMYRGYARVEASSVTGMLDDWLKNRGPVVPSVVRTGDHQVRVMAGMGQTVVISVDARGAEALVTSGPPPLAVNVPSGAVALRVFAAPGRLATDPKRVASCLLGQPEARCSLVYYELE